MNSNQDRKVIFETAVGLQDVDHLKNSDYFTNESKKYIDGEITLDDLDEAIEVYYENNSSNDEERTKEADIVSIRIAQLLEDNTFNFSISELLRIHKKLFGDIYKHAGKLRTYNFYKREWVLNGDTVIYGDYREIEACLQHDIEKEKKFKYKGLSVDKAIMHLANFVSDLWQIHAFEEGNTRTTAVFFIKYLRSLGFEIKNNTFAKNSWYFRNALVRANYNDYNEGLIEDKSFLVLFLRNLLIGENNELKNRYMHIDYEYHIQLSDTVKRIIEILKNNPKIKLKALADEVGLSTRVLKDYLSNLKDAGILVSEKSQ